MRMVKTCVAMFLGVFIFSNLSYGSATSSIEMMLPLPQNFDETNFNLEYPVKINGREQLIKGGLFLYNDLTYMPARAILENFHVDIKYNELDRSVILTDKDVSIIITPKKTIYDSSGALVKHGNTSVFEGDVGYLLVDDRSYLPLRFIAETLGYTVKYDGNINYITITGNRSLDNQDITLPDDQHVIIDAISKYEAKSTLSLNGTVDFLGTAKDIDVNINREHTKGDLVETIDVKEKDGQQYKSIRKVRWYGSTSTGVNEILPDGTEKIVDLFVYGGRHPYSELSKLKLCGLNKYGSMTIEKDAETAEIVTYKITELNGEKLNINVSIQKNSGELLFYLEETEFSKKSFTLVI